MQIRSAAAAGRLWAVAIALAATSCAVYQVPPFWPGSRIEGELQVLNARALGGGPIGPMVVYLESERPLPALAFDRPTVLRHDGRAFTPELVAVDVRRSLTLHNEGGLHHRLFWLEGARRREVDLAPRSVLEDGISLTRPGIARIYCELHPDEHFSVFAAPSHLYTVLDGPGAFTLGSVPPGSWRLHVWSEAVEGPIREVSVSAVRVSSEIVELDAERLVRR